MTDKLAQWAAAAAVRAVKTAAQSALGIIGASVALGEVDWALVASAAALAAIVSVLTSVAGIGEVEDGASVPQIIRASKSHTEL